MTKKLINQKFGSFIKDFRPTNENTHLTSGPIYIFVSAGNLRVRQAEGVAYEVASSLFRPQVFSTITSP